MMNNVFSLTTLLLLSLLCCIQFIRKDKSFIHFISGTLYEVITDSFGSVNNHRRGQCDFMNYKSVPSNLWLSNKVAIGEVVGNILGF